MKIEDMTVGDVLVQVDARGASFYRVVKVCRVIVKVMTEQGHVIRAYPSHFNRKIPTDKAAEYRASGIRIMLIRLTHTAPSCRVKSSGASAP